MAKPIDRISFKRVQLFKNKTIGIGSYGKVCRARCDDLLCAAKLMHETLFDPSSHYLIGPEKEHRLPVRRFEKECGYLNSIRHPNIVQCLCTFEDPDSGLPVLLMELMDDSLTRFLEKALMPVAYHIQVSICHDITLALSYLHSNGIVHRDLSSNNVLLIGDVRAKLSDFGMAKLSDTSHTFTMCPGTDVYMPPESVDDKPVYTEKIDCFSFGVIIVQILTRQFPKPGDRNKVIEIFHPQVHGCKVKVSVPEIERRQNQISLVDPHHPLLQMSFDCLKDSCDQRPSAQQLCERLIALKVSSEYTESENEPKRLEQIRSAEREKELRLIKMKHAQEVKELQETVKRQQNDSDEKDQVISEITLERDEAIAAGQKEMEQLRIRLQQCVIEKKKSLAESNLILEEKERQLQRVKQQLEISESAKVDYERRFQELEQQFYQEKQQLMEVGRGMTAERKVAKVASAIKMKWTKGKRAPCKMSLSSNAVLHSDVVYIRPPGKIVYAYSVNSLTWSQLPCCPASDCPIVVVNNLLTIVGGYDKDHCINELFSLTGEGSARTWSQTLPPMPTKRCGVAALCAGIALVVAGGVGEEESVLVAVEVLNTENQQWSVAANLLNPLINSLAVTCDGQVYLLGGDDEELKPTKSVHTCKLTALLKSTNPRSIAGHLKDTLKRSKKSKVWSTVADLPVYNSSCVFLHGSLVAIGGKDSELRPTSAVQVYVPISNSWEIISHMGTPRYSCFATVLTNNQLMVIGGVTDKSRTITDTVEMGSLLKLVIT